MVMKARTGGSSTRRLCGCGNLTMFVAKDPVQLDVDHIDRNPSNNDPSNLQTLCANCHRLKSKLGNDWRPHEKV